MPRSSRIWDYFTICENDPSKAECNTCKSKLSRGGTIPSNYTTTNLKNHLRKYHKPEYKQFEEAVQNDQKAKTEKQESQAASTSTTQNAKQVGLQQLKLQQAIDRSTVWSKDDPRTKETHKKLGEMIVLDMQPFSVVDDVGFQRYTYSLQPRYKLPSKTYVSEKLIPGIYKGVKTGLHDMINNVDHISVTTDLWTSPGGSHSLMSLTGHWINDTFVKRRGVLCASSFPGRHTGDNIKEEMERMFKEWDIEKSKIHTVLRDNGANVVNGMEKLGVDHQSCLIHTLQLVVSDGLKSQRTITDLIATGRRIVTHFKHSSQAHTKLEALQNKHSLPKHAMIQDVPTRWNSTYYLLERLNEQKDALVEFASLYDLPQMTANQWSLSKTLVNALQPFENLTRKLSAESATLASVIPDVVMLRRALTLQDPRNKDKYKGIQTTIDTMVESMDRRFSESELKESLAVATFLDPRYKDVFFQSAETKFRVREWLEDGVEPLQVESQEPMDMESETEGSEKEEQEESESNPLAAVYAAYLKEKGARAESSDGQNLTMKQEFDQYKSAPLVKGDNGTVALSWWGKNKVRFPKLSARARKYLSAPASSVSSERLFSEAGELYDAKRNRLAPNKAEMILIARGNLPLLKFDYKLQL
ncbi:zinc finger BED domain-containing protein 4-like [Amphiura filiformis]|uniref:zinc finger BED domain-containing protein 4-like n=1 Tax=Amphiura filiformis TaxID=82378 RepID=UPI003B214274